MRIYYNSSDPLNVGEISVLFQTGYLSIKKEEIRNGYVSHIKNLEKKTVAIEIK